MLIYYKQGASETSPLLHAPNSAIFHHNIVYIPAYIHSFNVLLANRAVKGQTLQTQHGEVSVVKETV